MSLDPVICFDRVSKRYGKQQALDGVTFEVPPGVVFALLGENGAGKSSTIRILLGLTEPDAGTTRVLGLSSQREGVQVRGSVGYVAERPALDEWMRVGELGWFVSGFYASDKFQENYQQQVRTFGVPLDRKIRELSKGMRSKVALALALASEPRLLILDEPTSGLDTMVRREFLESMVDFTSDGKTVFLASHQIHEVERVADIVAIVRAGKLLVCESLDTLKDNTTEVTATLREQYTPNELPAGVLTSAQRGRQWQLIVRANPDIAADTVRRLPGVEHVETHRPSLEEIFVAFMKTPEEQIPQALSGSPAEVWQ
ncbi:MAG: ABC transporter ATP-binding protein [Planctomycetales bacterium]|nr:ABC transporter ATP-binding protein [Planctomycetales bacterium]